jgi:hypothetical protein
MLGVLLTPAVMPIAFTVLWNKQSKHAALYGTLFGSACGLCTYQTDCGLVTDSHTVGWMRESGYLLSRGVAKHS